MASEYERRFLLDRLPDEDPVSRTLIRQVYWRLGGGWSVRLRRAGSDDVPVDSITVKGPRIGSERPEFEMALVTPEMSPEERQKALDAALNLYAVGQAHQVVKWRYSFFLDDIAWDIDEFIHQNAGLIIAEAETETQDGILKISRPTWAVREITTDARYNNENLAYAPFGSWDQTT